MKYVRKRNKKIVQLDSPKEWYEKQVWQCCDQAIGEPIPAHPRQQGEEGDAENPRHPARDVKPQPTFLIQVFGNFKNKIIIH